MPIPPHEATGILPPFVGDPNVGPGERSPYLTSSTELVARYGTTDKRRKILTGFFEYRKDLIAANLAVHWQWIDGSFVDQMARDPSDVDVISFMSPPAGAAMPPDLSPGKTKAKYLVDAYYLDLQDPAAQVVHMCTYWFGLFSHQRDSFKWRGFLLLPMVSDDDAALVQLKNGATPVP